MGESVGLSAPPAATAGANDGPAGSGSGPGCSPRRAGWCFGAGLAALCGVVLAFAIVLPAATGAVAQMRPASLCTPAGRIGEAAAALIAEYTDETGRSLRLRPRSPAIHAVQTRMLLENRSALCDLVVFPPHWLGGLAAAGDLQDLNAHAEAGALDTTGFLPAALYGYSSYPKGEQALWAIPFSGDGLAFVYRRDWFARPDLNAAFRDRHQRDLRAPGRQAELARIGAFFQGRTIDGAPAGGIALPTNEAGGGLVTAVTSLLFARGVRFADPPGSDAVDGVANSEQAAQALGDVRKLYECCATTDASSVRAVLDGRAAMAMGWLSDLAVIDRAQSADGSPARFGFFANPSGSENATVLAGYAIGVAAGSDQTRQAIDFLSWFTRDATQRLWWELGGLPLHRAIATAPALAAESAFSRTYLETLAGARGLPQRPGAEAMIMAMDAPLRRYVIEGSGTAQEALDSIVADWTAPLN